MYIHEFINLHIFKVGDVVEFTAEITLKECPKDRNKWKQMFTIYPVGVSESLTVELEMLCDCPCEHPGHHVSIIKNILESRYTNSSLDS